MSKHTEEAKARWDETLAALAARKGEKYAAALCNATQLYNFVAFCTFACNEGQVAPRVDAAIRDVSPHIQTHIGELLAIALFGAPLENLSTSSEWDEAHADIRMLLSIVIGDKDLLLPK